MTGVGRLGRVRGGVVEPASALVVPSSEGFLVVMKFHVKVRVKVNVKARVNVKVELCKGLLDTCAHGTLHSTRVAQVVVSWLAANEDFFQFLKIFVGFKGYKD